MENLPSIPVCIVRDVPFTFMDAPGTGNLSALLTTVPEIRCWANAENVKPVRGTNKSRDNNFLKVDTVMDLEMIEISLKETL